MGFAALQFRVSDFSMQVVAFQVCGQVSGFQVWGMSKGSPSCHECSADAQDIGRVVQLVEAMCDPCISDRLHGLLVKPLLCDVVRVNWEAMHSLLRESFQV